jgi:hypothetical protein
MSNALEEHPVPTPAAIRAYLEKTGWQQATKLHSDWVTYKKAVLEETIYVEALSSTAETAKGGLFESPKGILFESLKLIARIACIENRTTEAVLEDIEKSWVASQSPNNPEP